MAKLRYTLRLTNDGVLTIIVGRKRESIGLQDKTKAEIFEAVKWALISKDVYISEARLTEDLYEMIWQHV